MILNISDIIKKNNSELNKPPSFYVAIGGSAGGLEAFEQFFSNIPEGSGLAYIVLSHFDPNYKPMLSNILQRFTRMKVSQAIDGESIYANQVYILPPDKNMSILQGKIQLFSRGKDFEDLHMPIDFFLRDLAKDQGEKSIAVIVSGMGTDGTMGIQSIKEKFGMVMVQNPDSAKYKSMPLSAINSGFVDYNLNIEKIPKYLLDYVKKFKPDSNINCFQMETSENVLQKIFVLLRSSTNHDFSFYKKNTIYRRIERRIVINQLANIQDYIHFLQDHPLELKILFNDLLIGVTNFFRDKVVFENLKKVINTQILEKNPTKRTFRVWIPGCSTGEEAYSIAILIYECLQEKKLLEKIKVQIFATDINEDAIKIARLGTYNTNISLDISKKRLVDYFDQNGSKFIIKKKIRELIIFAIQNFIMEPPFINLDLISCRNVLIYLTPKLQKKIIKLFHYSLKINGILLLGTSESIIGFDDIFEVINNENKIFKKIKDSKLMINHLNLPISEFSDLREFKKSFNSENSVQKYLNSFLLDKFAPPSIVVNQKGDIIFISGKTGEFLEPSPGKAIMNIFTMARDGIKYELGDALYNFFKEKKNNILRDIRIKKSHLLLDIYLYKFKIPEVQKFMALIVFQKHPELKNLKFKTKKKPIQFSSESKEINELEKQLNFTKERLQSLIEEMQTSQEELKSSNEELQTTNEELQSTNEELKTSKEELKSLNEELITVNAELNDKIENLSTLNDDMKNVMNSIDTAIIFLDNNLCIKNFTSQATKIVNLIQDDIGRPINHLNITLKYKNLIEDIKHVIKTLVIKEIDVESDNKKWYSMRIMPYRTSKNLIDGVIIRFNDITQIKLAQNSSFFRTQIEDEIKPIVALISHPVLYIDLNYNVIFSNNAFLNTFLVSESEILNKSLFSIVDGIFNINLFQNLKKQFKSPQKSKIEFNFYTKIQNSYETTYSIVILKNEFDLMYNSPYRLIFRELIRNPLEEQEI